MADDQLPFFTQTAVLDTYLKMGDLANSETPVKIIAKALREKPDLYAYFFRTRPNPAWAEALLLEGYFKDAPEPVISGDGYVLPPWLEQDFLIAIAEEAPDVVARHVQIIQGHAIYKNRAIAALAKTSADTIENVLPDVMKWIVSDADSSSFGYFHLGGLIKKLAETKRPSAFYVFEIISAPFPPPKEESGFQRSAIAAFPFDDYSTGVTLGIIVDTLFEVSPEKTISIFETQLRRATDIEGQSLGYPEYKKNSFWRVAIEDSGQDSLNDFNDKLLVLLRNCLAKSLKHSPQTVRPTIERYLVDDYEIIRRLAFYLLTISPHEFRELVFRELVNQTNMDDVGLHHEYFELLHAGYAHINSMEQQELTKMILVGPPEETLERVSKRVEGESDKEREKYVLDYSKFWIRDRLLMIRDQIDGVPKETLDSLIAEMGTPEHPSFTRWTSGPYTVSEVSPTSVDEMRGKSTPELIEFLKNWRPIRRMGPTEESFRALGEEVASLIFSDLQKYSSVVSEIVSIHSAFATAFIYARNSKMVSAEERLELQLKIAGELLSDEEIRTSLGTTTQGHWVAFRFALIRILKDLIIDFDSNRSEDQLSAIRVLLTVLCDDPDPDQKADRPKAEWFGHEDPLTVAINHVRSEAVLSLILFANRLEAKRVEPEQLRIFDPDVSEMLSRKVARLTEPSMAVHSVFGMELERLYWLDKNWVIEKLPEIFPNSVGDEDIRFYISAWDCWVANHRVPRELFQLLRPQYERAIDNISNGYVTRIFNPVKGLANHILLDYQLSTYAISSTEGQDSLIAKFFKKTLPEHRGEMAWALSARTHQHKDEWARARDLWQWRYDTASIFNFSSDFEGEMDGYSGLLLAAPESESINTLWPLLQGFLHYLDNKKGWDRMWHNLQEFLAREANRFPLEAIRYYSLMHDQISEPRFYYEEEAKTIMQTGATNEISREETLFLIDKLNRRGSYDFQSIGEEILAGRF